MRFREDPYAAAMERSETTDSLRRLWNSFNRWGAPNLKRLNSWSMSTLDHRENQIRNSAVSWLRWPRCATRTI